MANTTLSGNEATVAAFLASKGLTQAQIAGIMGNWQVESGFNPNGPPGDGGLAHGIAQWHPDRFPSGGLPSDLMGQLNWFWTEAHTTEAGAFNEFLAQSGNPEQAAASFDKYYERSDGKSRPLREQDADAIYPQIAGAKQSGFWGNLGQGLLNSNPVTAGLSQGVSDVGTGVNAVETTAGFLAKVEAWVVQPSNWLRVGYFVLGGILIVVGGAKAVGAPNPIKAVAGKVV